MTTEKEELEKSEHIFMPVQKPTLGVFSSKMELSATKIAKAIYDQEAINNLLNDFHTMEETYYSHKLYEKEFPSLYPSKRFSLQKAREIKGIKEAIKVEEDLSPVFEKSIFPLINHEGKEITGPSSKPRRTYSVYMSDKDGNKSCKKVQAFRELYLDNSILQAYFKGCKILKVRIEPE